VSQFFITETVIEGLKVVERKPISDNRGFLARIFCADLLQGAGWQKPIAQINQTLTKKRGMVRGMHFQNFPHAEMKLVTCLQGEVWDVAIDLRSNSSTFLQWHAEILSSENCRAILIPEGFAHGFQALSDDCELLYLHSAPYAQHAEAGIHPNDPALNISWPLDPQYLSVKDAAHRLLTNQFTGVDL
jgi:dTDP-4-dehydrorhamnose 3,5-epimerase